MRGERAGREPAEERGDCITPAVRQTIAEQREAVLILNPQSWEVVAASAPAGELLAPIDADLLGRRLSELTELPASHAPELMADGRLNGYATRTSLPGRPGDPGPDLWLRTAPQRHGLPLLVALLDRRGAGNPERPAPFFRRTTGAVIGTCGAQLTVDRISDDTGGFLGHRSAEVLGQSLLRLVDAHDVPTFLWALAQATGSHEGVSLDIGMLRADRESVKCQLTMLPLLPGPSCAFSLLPELDLSAAARFASDMHRLLTQLRQGIDAAAAARELTESRSRRIPGYDLLTARELEIVERLVAGDRVPAISQQLFIAQSTVRNHLSTIFSKLGVGSQQGLIVLLRRIDSAPVDT